MEPLRYNKSALVRQDAIGLKIYLHTWLTDGLPYAKLVINMGSLVQFDLKLDLKELKIVAHLLADLFNAYDKEHK